MKHLHKILYASLILVALPFAWTGCVGYAGGERGVVYGGGGPWFHDDVWVDGGGRGWYGGHSGEAYAHPGGGDDRRGGGHR